MSEYTVTLSKKELDEIVAVLSNCKAGDVYPVLKILESKVVESSKEKEDSQNKE